MVEPPSRRLQQILLGLKLCSPRDLRRCASRVKALSADLPAFDSVWLDALVHRRLLTSWQAQAIEADQPELLRIGPCIIEDRIGQSHRSATYLARLPDQQGQCVIKRVVVPSELRQSINDRLNQLTEKSPGLTQSGVIVPHSVSEVPNAPIPELASSEKLKESAATRASRQTGTVSTSKKRGTKAGVGRARHKTKAVSRERSDKLNTELAIVSRWVDGLSLSEILLRRGRLPAAEVDAIARQLLDSLATLHDAGIVHGEILLSNIRLLPSGQAVLVDSGIRPAIHPGLKISAHVSPEQNDGIAPELIGTGAAATPRSDLYALGFALWHVLAGRPAFPTGDPLARLAAHQTERLSDIREFAPDTPDQLARTIEWLTDPVPSRRPRNARELLVDGTRGRTTTSRQNVRRLDNKASKPEDEQQAKNSSDIALSTQAVSIKPAGRSSRRRLAKFASGFQQPVRRTSQSPPTHQTARSIACACAAVLVAIGALLTFDATARNVVLARLPQRFVESISNDGSVTDESLAAQPVTESPTGSDESPGTTATMNRVNGNGETLATTPQQRTGSVVRQKPQPVPQDFSLLPLPEPDPYGLVLLSEPGNYDANSILWPGSHLIIRGATDVPATIVISTRPLQLRAIEVTLENVELRLKPNPASTLASMSQIRSQKLTCRKCNFLTPLSAMSQSGVPAVSSALSSGLAIQWAPIDASDPLAGHLEFINCQLAGSHSSIMLTAPGQKVRCLNTLKLGGGPLFIATGRASNGDNTFEIEQTTLRDSGSLIAIDLRNTAPWKSRLTIKPVSSVFELRHRSVNEAESLITFVGGRLQLAWYERVTFEGEDSFAGSFVRLASWQGSNSSEHQALDAAYVSVSGLMQTEFTFHGPPGKERANSILTDTQTNRLSSQLPGISNNSGRSTQIPDDEMLLIHPEISPTP